MFEVYTNYNRGLVLTARIGSTLASERAAKKRKVTNHNKSGRIFEAITMFTLFDTV